MHSQTEFGNEKWSVVAPELTLERQGRHTQRRRWERDKKWWVAARFGGFRYRSTHPTLAIIWERGKSVNFVKKLYLTRKMGMRTT